MKFRNIARKFAPVVAAVGSSAAFAAATNYDTTAVTGEMDLAKVAIASIGAAVLVVAVATKAWKWIKGAM
ncbi:major capsid protein [Chitinimonas sp.]|uniref:major capsid protein n=1 Tax=Chitinimonas sp. TaxID=1934313 RepID=UPI002F95C7C0